MPVEFWQEQEGKLILARVSGKLTKKDYEYFVPAVERLMAKPGKVRMVFEMHDFHGWDMGALWEDVKFDLKHFNDIERIAMVGDKKWEAWMAKFCTPFTTAKIRYFDHSELEQARAWVEEREVRKAGG